MFNLKDVLKPSANPYGNELVRDNVAHCLSLNLPEIFMTPAHGGELNIVGGGPSLDGQIERLSKRKSPIWAVNGSVKYILKHGLMPKAMVILDSGKVVADMIPDEEIEFLVASQADPSVFKKLEGKKAKVWHALVDAGEEALIREARKDYVMIGGGCGSVHRCINLGYALGFRKFHMFGFDCSLYKEKQERHAYGTETELNLIEITLNNKTYLSEGYLARQAQDFIDMLHYFDEQIDAKNIEPIELTLYGNGLAQDIAESMGLPVVN